MPRADIDSIVGAVDKLCINEKKADSGSDGEPEDALRSIDAKRGADPEEDGHYISKGPIRRSVGLATPAAHPYARQDVQAWERAANGIVTDEDLERVLGDDYNEDLYPDLVGISTESAPAVKCSIPGLPRDEGQTAPPEVEGKLPRPMLMNNLDDLFEIQAAKTTADMSTSTCASRVMLRNVTEGGFSVLNAALSLVIDESAGRIGISVPRMQVPTKTIPQDLRTEGRLEVFLQLDPGRSKIIRVQATVEMWGDSSWGLQAQCLTLNPFSGASGVSSLMKGVSRQDLDRAVELVSAKPIDDLRKTFGPNQCTLLMTLCCNNTDNSLQRAKILAVTKRLLAHPDPAVRRDIVKRDLVGSTSLDYAALLNKPDVAHFLAEIFYDLGEDLNAQDVSGNTFLHLLARKGEETAAVLQMFLGLRFKDSHPSGPSFSRKVVQSTLRNSRLEAPIHIVARNAQCQPRTIQLLHLDSQDCLTAAAEDGSLPLHYACQMSSDPALLAALLYYNRHVVNARRKDGFTPLHLIASRSDVSDNQCKLIPLDEEVQLRMINILLDHGADRNLTVEGFRPMDLPKHDRTRARLLLKLARRSGSRNNSPTSGSPPTGAMPMAPRLAEFSPASSGFCGSEMSPHSVVSSHSPSSTAANYSPPSGSSPSFGRFDYSLNLADPASVASTLSSEADSEDSLALEAIVEDLSRHPTIQAAIRAAENQF